MDGRWALHLGTPACTRRPERQPGSRRARLNRDGSNAPLCLLPARQSRGRRARPYALQTTRRTVVGTSIRRDPPLTRRIDRHGQGSGLLRPRQGARRTCPKPGHAVAVSHGRGPRQYHRGTAVHRVLEPRRAPAQQERRRTGRRSSAVTCLGWGPRYVANHLGGVASPAPRLSPCQSMIAHWSSRLQRGWPHRLAGRSKNTFTLAVEQVPTRKWEGGVSRWPPPAVRRRLTPAAGRSTASQFLCRPRRPPPTATRARGGWPRDKSI